MEAVEGSYEFQTVIVWFRRDLRVDDNPALVAALRSAANVIPVFIWAPEEEGQFQPGRCSRWWSKHSLIDLQQALAALGSRLIIRRSTDSTAALLQVVAEVGAEAVFFNHLYDPISLMRDHDCKRGLAAAGVAHRTFNGDMLYEPWELLDANKQPYSTFNDYWCSVRAMPVAPPFPISAPAAMPPVLASVASMAVGEVDWFFTAEQEASSDQLKYKWKPGVGGAIAELERFLAERLFVFEHDRAKVDRDSTSRLSPWIHIGSISVRYIFYRVRQCQAEWLAAGYDRTRSCDDFLQQVGYREYSRYLSFHFPFIHERSLLRHLRACPWRIDQHAFKAWRQGQTGYPIVDAAMRQLWSSGWCHNRARVVAASFLVKDLLLPWQWGLKHYWDAQIDADLECDALGWQYVSGGMSDAHPFSYMMDLETEARRFDPDGEYVRRWLPVLSRLPTEYIHSPWKAPPQVLAAADVELGCNYPAPIISRPEASANVKYACTILDKCAVPQSSDSSGRYPYRAPTYPLGPGGGAAASSGANPTGTGAAVGADGAGASGDGRAGGSGAGGSSGQQQQQQQQPAPQQYGQTGAREGVSAGLTDGTGTGMGSDQVHAMFPGSRTASAAYGGAGSGAGGGGSGAGTQVAAEPHGAMAGVPPPQGPAQGLCAGAGAGGSGGGSGQAAPAAAAPLPPGGAVYYHPGDTAGHQMLERILQQQRRARGAGRQQDGSGTNRPLQGLQQQRQQHLMAPLGPMGEAAAAAWARRGEAGEEEEEQDENEAVAAALWQQLQQQQGLPALQGGATAAALAFQQAMQLLFARRRMGDGASVISGEREREGEEGLMGEGIADSEEVMSNTVGLNVPAITGASCYRLQAGTARGARERERGEAAAAVAGSKRLAEETPSRRSGGGETGAAGVAGPPGQPPPRRAHRHDRPAGDAGGAAEMQCEVGLYEAARGGAGEDEGGEGRRVLEARTPQGGAEAESPSNSNGYAGAPGAGQGDPMRDSESEEEEEGGGGGGVAALSSRELRGCASPAEAGPGAVVERKVVEEGLPAEQPGSGAHAHGLHKRRRSGSGSIDWE